MIRLDRETCSEKLYVARYEFDVAGRNQVGMICCNNHYQIITAMDDLLTDGDVKKITITKE